MPDLEENAQELIRENTCPVVGCGAGLIRPEHTISKRVCSECDEVFYVTND